MGAERSPKKDKKKDDGCLHLFIVQYLRDAALYASVEPCRNVTLYIGLKLVCLKWRKDNGTSCLLHVRT